MIIIYHQDYHYKILDIENKRCSIWLEHIPKAVLTLGACAQEDIDEILGSHANYILCTCEDLEEFRQKYPEEFI